MVKVCTAKQLEHLKELLSSGGDVSIAVAYVRQSGLSLIEDELTTALSKSEVRMLISLDGRTTEPEAVKKLFELTEKGLKARFFDVPSREYAIFHPKLYISRSGESTTFLTGSYNLTGAALLRNREHGLRVTCSNSEKEGKEALEYFNGLWEDDLAKCLTRAAVDDYAERYVGIGSLPSDEELPDRNYWLFKCNPVRHQQYTFGNLIQHRIDSWGEIGMDSASRRYIKQDIRPGDHVLFYHSGNGHKMVVGTAHVTRGAYSMDPDEQPVIDLRAIGYLRQPVPLANIRAIREMYDLLPRNERLAISRADPREYAEIVRIGMG